MYVLKIIKADCNKFMNDLIDDFVVNDYILMLIMYMNDYIDDYVVNYSINAIYLVR